MKPLPTRADKHQDVVMQIQNRIEAPRHLQLVVSEAIVRISPETGLTTDFTNVFNEIIMLLEMLPDWPEALDETRPWKSFDYVEHFASSHYVDKALIIEAYELAPMHLRIALGAMIDAANAMLLADLPLLQDPTTRDMAQAAVLAQALRSLVAAMTAIVNGVVGTSAQDSVDNLFGDDSSPAMSADDIDALFD